MDALRTYRLESPKEYAEMMQAVKALHAKFGVMKMISQPQPGSPDAPASGAYGGRLAA